MNPLFTQFLILTNHIAHGLLNTHLIPILTVFLLFWSLSRVFRAEPSSERSLRFFHRSSHWINLVCMIIKPGISSGIPSLSSSPHLFRIFYPLTLAPYWIRGLSVRRKTILLAAGAMIYYLASLASESTPGIDVFIANNMGLDHFFRGVNPYTQPYPQELSGGRGYRPGFLYWPTTLYLEGLSRLLFGDIRVILAVLWWAAPFFFPKTESSAQDLSLKTVWWFLPFLNFCLKWAWIDPILSFSVSVLIFGLLNRNWWISALAIALAASAKQFGGMFGAFALLYLFVSEPKKGPAFRVALLSAVLFGLLMAPFLLWDFHAFFDMTVKSHLEAAVRLDALTFTAWWIAVAGGEFSGRAQGIMTLVGFGLAVTHLIRNSRRAGLRTLPEAWSIAFGFSVVFGKFGFANYYLLWVSLMILTLTLERAAKTGDASES